VEVEFYCKDARDVFLSPKSVDLFLIHPPFFKMKKDQYGGDPDIQINNTDDKEEFDKSLVKFLNNMSDALTDNGNILFILPNRHSSIESIATIVRDTDLEIYNIILWDFEKTKIVENKYNSNLILHIRKNTEFEYPGQKLPSSAIEQDWLPWWSDLSKYEDIGFVYDAFPMEIADTLIKSFSKEGDTVADIFGGTGTTVISALKNNRKAIYSDVSEIQLEVAKKRVSDIIKESEPTIQKEKVMTKEEVVNLMLNSINEDNKAMGIQAGLNEADLDAQIAQSQPSLSFMMSNIYDKLQAGGVIA
jgi:DNA modification methylase